MYNDWPSLNVAQLFEENRWSVVHKLPSINGQGVVNEVVKPLALSLIANNVQANATNPHASLHTSTDRDSAFFAGYSGSTSAGHGPPTSGPSTSTLLSANASSATPLTPFDSDDLGARDEFGANLGRDTSLGSSINMSAVLSEPSDYTYYLKTDQDVQWVMEVICYGLSLPISSTEHYETVRDCVHIYCEWLFALAPDKSRRKLIPTPVRDDPTLYFKRMLNHLYNIFVPRVNSSTSTEMAATDVISKQALLCHRVLRTISMLAEDDNNLLTDDSWETVLRFLLAINDVLLSQPSEREDIGTHLCERVVSVLFEIWTIACARCFPSSSYWKTLHELFVTWRHRPAVVDQWAKVCLLFTQRLVALSNPDDSIESSAPTGSSGATNTLHEPNESADYGGSGLPSQQSPQPVAPYAYRLLFEMPYEVISQAWYRFVHTIGDPVDLSSAEIISRSKRFFSLAADSVVDPRQHPCLDVLPVNFHRAMRGLAAIVDTLLGLRSKDLSQATPPSNVTHSSHVVSNAFSFNPASITSNVYADKTLTPPNGRKSSAMKQLGKHMGLGSLHSTSKSTSGSSIPSASSFQAPYPTQPISSAPTLAPISVTSAHVNLVNHNLPFGRPLQFGSQRPTVNSLLNIFGDWLFGAANVCNENHSERIKRLQRSSSCNSSGSTEPSDSTSTSGQTSASFGVANSDQRRGSTDRVAIELSTALQPINFEAGAAEALGCLCRVFASKYTDEDVAHVYYARFYLSLSCALARSHVPRRLPLLSSSALSNGSALFERGLSGVHVLLPALLPSLEALTGDRDVPAARDLRRAGARLLLSLLAVPLHFGKLPIKTCLVEQANEYTFASLRPRLLRLLLQLFHIETDSANVQLLLVGLLATVEDSLAALSECGPDRGAAEICDDAPEVFRHVLQLASQTLIGQWKHDTQVCLAALEVLGALARVRYHRLPVEDCARAVRLICDYIVAQCSRPPPQHSKDLHSTIVAAYACLTVWFAEHAQLLRDADCVHDLLEVIELGVSGCKSRSSVPNSGALSSSNSSIRSAGSAMSTASAVSATNISTVFKRDKEPKPASMRVRDAAEHVLHCLMNQFGQSASAPCPPEAMNGCCDLDEQNLLLHLTGSSADLSLRPFKHFVSEGQVLISFANHPQDSSCLCLIRTPFGKFCWKVDFQMQSNKLVGPISVKEVPRPFAANFTLNKPPPTPRHFPESIDQIPKTPL
jgi:hypothetical protein